MVSDHNEQIYIIKNIIYILILIISNFNFSEHNHIFDICWYVKSHIENIYL